ncbi:MAG: saccharopine dehydrogenase C-terminal domain-containing protein [Pseudomonadota bacterium]
MSHMYAIIGAGRTGKAAAYDLARHGQARAIRLFDIDGGRARAVADELRPLLATLAQPPEITAAPLDAADLDATARAIAGSDAVMSCSAYWLNADLAAVAIAQKAHFNDLGGNTEVVQRELALDARARAAGVSIVPDCGLAPGLVNTLAAAGMGRLARCERVALRCGGLPQQPRGPLDYALSFSITGLTNEYTGQAFVLRDGALVTVPALAELEDIHFDGLPPLEAFVTTGGASTAPESFAGTVRDYDYKTMRYRGHCQKLRLLDALGLFSLQPVEVEAQQVVPRRLLEAVMGPRLSFADSRDLILVRVTCEGVLADGSRARVVFEMVDRHDEATGLSAMERCTSFPAAAVTHLQASGGVAPGARRLETEVPAEPLLAATRARGLEIRERLEKL